MIRHELSSDTNDVQKLTFLKGSLQNKIKRLKLGPCTKGGGVWLQDQRQFPYLKYGIGT